MTLARRDPQRTGAEPHSAATAGGHGDCISQACIHSEPRRCVTDALFLGFRSRCSCGPCGYGSIGSAVLFQRSKDAMVTVPSGSEPQVAFISGVAPTRKAGHHPLQPGGGNTQATFLRAERRARDEVGPRLSDRPAAPWRTGSTARRNGRPPSRRHRRSQPGAVVGVGRYGFTLAPSEQAANQVFFRATGTKQTYQSPSFSRPRRRQRPRRTDHEVEDPHRYQPAVLACRHLLRRCRRLWWQMLHEIGHMLGLGPAGPTTAMSTSQPSSSSAPTTRAWTLMSYIDPTNAKAKFFDDYPVTADWG